MYSMGRRTGGAGIDIPRRRRANLRRAATFLLLALLAGCRSDPVRSDPSPTVVAPGEEFTLRPGDVADLPQAGLTLRFEEVSEDSRCPAGVQCVWEGRAIVQLTAIGPDDASRRIDLELRTPPHGEELYGYRLEFLRLAPPARSGRRIEPNEYRATLRLVPIP